MSKLLIAQETIPSDENKYIENLAAQLKAKIIRENSTGIMRRDAHQKMHGVVKAEFIVEPNLPPELSIGVFSKPKTYKAWIRFSNQDSGINPDKNGDIRGMAIKLMDVPGAKLPPYEQDETTHDFILISTNVFVTKDAKEFDNLINAFTGSNMLKLTFLLTHWRVGFNLFKSMVKFANPLQIRYFSATPYLFGHNAVKYSAIPHIKNPDLIPDNPADDYLHLAMIKQLQQGNALFDFTLQLQTNAKKMPIEDPGHEWKESISPFRKVATIKILQQEFDRKEQKEFGENLSFSPWRALPEHRPLGGVNRARRVVYEVISQFRHEYNNIARKEPNGWDI